MTLKPYPTVLLVMGVTAAGKTTIARALAQKLQWQFLDADDLHSPANVAKMAAGHPLTDADRAPWLDALHARITKAVTDRTPTVLACSALKQSYRNHIWSGPEMVIVHLLLTPGEARERLQKRKEHFMPESLIESQFATLEPPAEAIRVRATQPIEDVCNDVLQQLAADYHLPNSSPAV